jgi:dephospho-CoA kinase
MCGRNNIVIGITGGIATGKTTVAGMLGAFGAKVVSADEIVYELMRPHTDVWRSIVDEFGEEILSSDGTIDRKRLARVVFRDAERRSRLESITHPRVFARLAEIAKSFREHDNGVLIIEIPLLVETSSEWLVDKVIAVTAEQDAQICRLKYRYGIDDREALCRIRSQMPLSEKVKFADWIVSTDGSVQSTSEQVASVWGNIQKQLAPRI